MPNPARRTALDKAAKEVPFTRKSKEEANRRKIDERLNKTLAQPPSQIKSTPVERSKPKNVIHKEMKNGVPSFTHKPKQTSTY